MSGHLPITRYSKTQSQGLHQIVSKDTYNLSLEALIEAIDSKTIAGIVTIASGTTEVSVLHFPICHRDGNGDVTHIIGNPSDKKGEFAMSKFDISCVRAVLHIGEDADVPPSSSPKVPIEVEHLVGTKYEGMANMVGATITNFAVLPFQSQDLIGIDITDANQMHAISTSVIFEWLGLANNHIENQDDIEKIVESVLQGNEVANRNTYFEPNLDVQGTPPLQLAVNGMHCTLVSASSDMYADEAAKLQAFYSIKPSSPASKSSTDKTTESLVNALSQVIAPDEQGEKEKAKMGTSILSLFAVVGVVDFDGKKITSLAVPTHSSGFKYVLAMNLKNRALALVQLHSKHMNNGRKLNPENVRSAGIKNVNIDLSTAAKILAGEFSIQSLVDTASNPADTISAAFFLPTPSAASSDLAVVIPKQSFFKLMVARVAAMKGLEDIKSLLVHVITFLGIFVDGVEKTVLYQMMNRMLILIHQPTFSDWFDKYGHDFIFSAFRTVEQIIIYVSKFGLDLHNVNAVMCAQSGVPPALDDDHLVKALSVFRIFEANVGDAIANETGLPSQSGVALSYKTLANKAKEAAPATKTNATESKSSASGSNDQSKQQKARTPQSDTPGESKPKRPRRSKVDTIPAAERKPATELGMIIPTPGTAKNKIMPPTVRINDKEVCMDFACMGHSCPHSFGACTRAHVIKPSDFTTEDLHKTAKHFIDNGVAKFNPASFRNTVLPDDLKSAIAG